MLVIEYALEESEYNKSFLYIEVLIGISDYTSTHFLHLEDGYLLMLMQQTNKKANTNRFNTANAETLVTMGSKLEAEGFPTPIVYDNTDIAKKIDFNEFRKGYRE